MASDLALFSFTPGNDTADSGDGWDVIGVTIDAKAGDDSISGSGDDFGIVNDYGIINGGAGNDSISGTGYYAGIYNTGTINGGPGNDSISGTVDVSILNGTGISNVGTINGDGGNDYISGTGDYAGIYNTGTINGGPGNDVVDALTGGFGGNGTVDLGGGKDTLKGFRNSELDDNGTFIGGLGIDKILLGNGNYTVASAGADWTITQNAVTMTIKEFEQIGGINSGLFNFGNGTLTVSNVGVGTFVPA